MLSAEPESEAQAEHEGKAEAEREREALAERERTAVLVSELNAKANDLAEARDQQQVRKLKTIIEAECVAKPEAKLIRHRPVTVTVIPTISVGTEVKKVDTRSSYQLAVLSAKPESKAQAELKGIAKVGRDREALAERERTPLFENELNAKAKYLAEARDLQEVRRHEAIIETECVSKPVMTHRPVTVTILPELKRKRLDNVRWRRFFSFLIVSIDFRWLRTSFTFFCIASWRL